MIETMPRKPMSTFGVPPRERGASRPPREHAVASPPPWHGVSPPPNPRRPRLVLDVDGGGLRDLFAMFPDLPRPSDRRTRPAPRAVRGALPRKVR